MLSGDGSSARRNGDLSCQGALERTSPRSIVIEGTEALLTRVNKIASSVYRPLITNADSLYCR